MFTVCHKNLLFFIFIFGILTRRINSNEVEYNNQDVDASDYYDEDNYIDNEESYKGSTKSRRSDNDCLTNDEIAEFYKIKEFQNLVRGTDNELKLENSQSIEVMLKYFYESTNVVSQIGREVGLYASHKAFYEVFGGFLIYFYIPLVKFSFYAGFLRIEDVEKVLSLKDRYINVTQQNDWQNIVPNFSQFEYQIKPFNVTLPSEDSIASERACDDLELVEDDNGDDDDDDEMVVPLPRLEKFDNGTSHIIWLPFKGKGDFVLTARPSAFNLVRYYMLAIDCHRLRNSSAMKYRKQFSVWLALNIYGLFYEPVFYPGLGSVLRIRESLRRSGIYQEKLGLINEDDVSSQSEEFKRIRDQIRKQHDSREPGFFERYFFPAMDQKKRHKYILVAILLIFIIFITVVFVAAYLKRQKRKQQQKDKHFDGSHYKPTPVKEPRIKSSGCFGKIFCRKKPQHDEEIELGPDSSSLMSRNKTKYSRSSKTEDTVKDRKAFLERDQKTKNSPKTNSRSRGLLLNLRNKKRNDSGTDSSVETSNYKKTDLKRNATPKPLVHFERSVETNELKRRNRLKAGSSTKPTKIPIFRKPDETKMTQLDPNDASTLRRSQTTINEIKPIPREQSADSNYRKHKIKIVSPRLRTKTAFVLSQNHKDSSTGSWETIPG